MADYGYYGGSKKRRRGRHNTNSGKRFDKTGLSVGGMLLHVTDVAVAVISVLLAAAFLMALAARWVAPEKMPVFAVAGLFYPFIYVANIVCVLYWAMRWSKMFWLSFAAVFMGLGSIKLFYRPVLTKTYQAEQTEQSDYEQEQHAGFVVMSYNVQGFNGPDIMDRRENHVKEIANLANEKEAAIICFQEFNKTDSNLDMLNSSLENMRYSVFVNYEEDAPDANGMGIAIYSVYPIVNSGVVDMETARIHSLWADVKIDRDTVRIISNHLQNQNITQKDRRETITTKLISDTAATEKVLVLSRKLAANYKLRAVQARKLHEFILSSPYEVIVCGDFNDTAASYTYHTVGKKLTDTFTECGSGFVHTYSEFANVLRIDFTLVSQGFDISGYEVPDVAFSDHLPVFSVVALETGTDE